MKLRLTVAIVVVLAMALMAVGLASADPPPDNPNVTILTNAVCADGSSFATITVPGQGVVGMDPDSNVVGLAKSLYIDVGGGTFVLIFERGAQGNPNLVWCEWDSPDGHFGGDVLFTPGGP